MQVITGGFAQGKLISVLNDLKERGIPDSACLIIDENNYRSFMDKSSVSEITETHVIINHLNLIIKDHADQAAVKEWIFMLKDMLDGKSAELTVISDELGCGIIPIDPMDRKYREDNGRLMCDLAAAADRVVRIVLGIPQVIK